MSNAIEIAEKIKKNPEKNWLPDLELLNLHVIFRPIYKGHYQFETPSKIIAFIILSYDNDSPWIDLKKDRRENKLSIIRGLDADPNSKVFKEILNYENDDVQNIILEYLLNQIDHRWQEVMSLLDYSSKMILFCNQNTGDKFKTGSKVMNEKTGELEDEYKFLDPADIAKANKEKGQLLDQAILSRKRAEDILKTMEDDFQKVDHATQADFDFQFSDVKKFDILSWEDRIIRKKSLGS
jgi:hypothetical protein